MSDFYYSDKDNVGDVVCINGQQVKVTRLGKPFRVYKDEALEYGLKPDKDYWANRTYYEVI